MLDATVHIIYLLWDWGKCSLRLASSCFTLKFGLKLSCTQPSCIKELTNILANKKHSVTIWKSSDTSEDLTSEITVSDQLKYLIFMHFIFYRSSHPEVFCKKSLLINFAKLMGKHLCQSLLYNKVAGLRPASCFCFYQ